MARGEIKDWNHQEWGESVAVDKTVQSVDAKDYDAICHGPWTQKCGRQLGRSGGGGGW
jgi:hypothetical protein